MAYKGPPSLMKQSEGFLKAMGMSDIDKINIYVPETLPNGASTERYVSRLNSLNHEISLLTEFATKGAPLILSVAEAASEHPHANEMKKDTFKAMGKAYTKSGDIEAEHNRIGIEFSKASSELPILQVGDDNGITQVTINPFLTYSFGVNEKGVLALLKSEAPELFAKAS